MVRSGQSYFCDLLFSVNNVFFVLVHRQWHSKKEKKTKKTMIEIKRTIIESFIGSFCNGIVFYYVSESKEM